VFFAVRLMGAARSVRVRRSCRKDTDGRTGYRRHRSVQIAVAPFRWIPSFKLSTVAPVKQPFCSQLEERLLLWLEYYPTTLATYLYTSAE